MKIDTKLLKNLLSLYKLKSFGYKYISQEDINKILQKKIQAKRALKTPKDIIQLQEFIQNCSLCQLSKNTSKKIIGSQIVFNPKIMFIGDYPRNIENSDIFETKSGQILKNMITKVLKLNLDQIYYTSILKCQISHNQNYQEFSSFCIDYIHTQIEILNPSLIVALGENSFKMLDNNNLNFKQIRGTKVQYIHNNKKIDMVATFHPSFFIRNPSAKVEAMQDLATIKDIIT